MNYFYLDKLWCWVRFWRVKSIKCRRNNRLSRWWSYLCVGVMTVIAVVSPALIASSPSQTQLPALGESAGVRQYGGSVGAVSAQVAPIQGTGEIRFPQRQVLPPVLGRLYRLELALEGKRRQRHFGRVSSVAISPDGKTVVSGGNDRTVRLWDLKGLPAAAERAFHLPKYAILCFWQPALAREPKADGCLEIGSHLNLKTIRWVDFSLVWMPVSLTL